MESVLGRYRNLVILVGILFLQVFGLAVQVKRATENESSRLIRVWAVNAITPLEKSIVWVQNGTRNLWHNYFYLRGVRQENRDLRQKIEQMQIEEARLAEDAEQAHRLQALLGFKEQFISKTLAAQVIGSSGSEQSRSIYLDKGARDGIRPDMAVITGEGVVGKVLHVYRSTSQVLLINDQTSGVGAILEKTRLQGVMRGTPMGEVVLEKVMADESVQPGERVLTSGGDQIFPKGLPVGTVTKVSRGQDLFLNIRIRPTANLSKLEEVLVVTQQEEREPVVSGKESVRAADILAQRLPSVPEKPPGPVSNVPPPTSGLKIVPPPGNQAGSQGTGKNPGGTNAPAQTGSRETAPKTQADVATLKPTNAAKSATAPGVKPLPPAPAAKAPVSEPNKAKPKTPSESGQVAPAPATESPSRPQDQPH